MRKYTAVVLIGLMLVFTAALQADTVVRKSGKTIRGQIQPSGDFLEVKTSDGRFLMLRNGDIRRAETSDGRVLVDNEPEKKEQTESGDKEKKTPAEHVILKSGEKVEGDISIYGDMVELRDEEGELRILQKDNIRKFVNDGKVVVENPSPGPPQYRPVDIGPVLYPESQQEGAGMEGSSGGGFGGPGSMGGPSERQGYPAGGPSGEGRMPPREGGGFGGGRTPPGGGQMGGRGGGQGFGAPGGREESPQR